MKPSAKKPKDSDLTPNAKDDLKSLPLPEVERDQRRQTSVIPAGAREGIHYADDSQ